jgi:RHS repeat-associated protein
VTFAYDQGGQLIGEYDQTGAPIREYVWLNSTPVAVFTHATSPAGPADPTRVFYIHGDHLDTPRAVTDTEGNLRWRWMAEPFGTTAPESNPQALGAFSLPLRMPGQYADDESGLFYNYFRSYDGSTGRYTQSDPIGLDGGINTYAHAFNQPTKYVDPDGLSPAAAGLCLIPGVGWAGCAAAGAAAVGGAILMSPPGRRAIKSIAQKIQDLCTPDEDLCDAQQAQEEFSCGKYRGWVFRACMERASIRGDMCRRKQPDPPPPWSDADVNGWAPPPAPRGR